MRLRSCALARRALVAALALCLWPAAASAQIPDGYFAFATSPAPSGSGIAWTGLGGVYVGHPRNPGAMTTVQGLPPELTGAGYPFSYWQGCSDIAIHRETGDLLIGEEGPTGSTIELHRVSLDSALNVTNHRRYVLGVASAAASDSDVSQLAQIDERTVVVVCNGVVGPIAIGSNAVAIGTVDLLTGSPNPWPVSSQFGIKRSANAICVDAAKGVAYVVAGDNGFSGPNDIWSIPLGNPTTRTWIASVPALIDNLELEHNGKILASCRGTGTAIYRIDPLTGIVTPVLTAWDNATALAIEPATGCLIFSGVPVRGAGTGFGVFHFDPTGTAGPTFLSNTSAGITGVPRGLAVAPDPVPYGQPTGMTPSTPSCRWSTAPRPNGLPLVGNRNFGIEVSCPAGTAIVGGWVASLGSSTTGWPKIPGTPLDLLVDLNLSLAASGFPPGSLTQPLPIPNTPSLQGAELYFQAIVGTAAGQAAATDGLRITFL